MLRCGEFLDFLQQIRTIFARVVSRISAASAYCYFMDQLIVCLKEKVYFSFIIIHGVLTAGEV